MSSLFNQLSKTQIVILVLVFVVVTIAPGCFRAWKDIETPQYFVDQGVPQTVKLAQVPQAQEASDAKHEFAMGQWDSNEQAGEDQIQWIEGIVDVLKDPATLSAIGLNPAGGAVSTILLLAGFLTPSPGHAKSKRDSYNKGVEDAKKMIEVGKTLIDKPAEEATNSGDSE